MVVLNQHFTVLAAISALAVVSLLPAPVSSAALPDAYRRQPTVPHQWADSQRGPKGTPDRSPDVHGKDASAASTGPLSLGSTSGLLGGGIPSLPLPSRSIKRHEKTVRSISGVTMRALNIPSAEVGPAGPPCAGWFSLDRRSSPSLQT